MSGIQRHRSRDGLDEQALHDSADPPLAIPHHRFRIADSRSAEAGTPVETDPLARRGMEKSHRDSSNEENMGADVERGGDPVAEAAPPPPPSPRGGVSPRHHR